MIHDKKFEIIKYIKNNILSQYMFSINDSSTRDNIIIQIKNYLYQLVIINDIYDYEFIFDDFDFTKPSQLICRIGIKYSVLDDFEWWILTIGENINIAIDLNIKSKDYVKFLRTFIKE